MGAGKESRRAVAWRGNHENVCERPARVRIISGALIYKPPFSPLGEPRGLGKGRGERGRQEAVAQMLIL